MRLTSRSFDENGCAATSFCRRESTTFSTRPSAMAPRAFSITSIHTSRESRSIAYGTHTRVLRGAFLAHAQEALDAPGIHRPQRVHLQHASAFVLDEHHFRQHEAKAGERPLQLVDGRGIFGIEAVEGKEHRRLLGRRRSGRGVPKPPGKHARIAFDDVSDMHLLEVDVLEDRQRNAASQSHVAHRMRFVEVDELVGEPLLHHAEGIDDVRVDGHGHGVDLRHESLHVRTPATRHRRIARRKSGERAIGSAAARASGQQLRGIPNTHRYTERKSTATSKENDMKRFFNELKEFINRGNVMDLAVAVIIGGAFTAIVTSLTNDIVNPLITAITGGGAARYPGSSFPEPPSTSASSSAPSSTSSSLRSWCFLLVKAINKVQGVGGRVLKLNKDGQQVVDVAPTCPFCLEEVRGRSHALSALHRGLRRARAKDRQGRGSVNPAAQANRLPARARKPLPLGNSNPAGEEAPPCDSGNEKTHENARRAPMRTLVSALMRDEKKGKELLVLTAASRTECFTRSCSSARLPSLKRSSVPTR